jgi:hypothetical protein
MRHSRYFVPSAVALSLALLSLHVNGFSPTTFSKAWSRTDRSYFVDGVALTKTAGTNRDGPRIVLSAASTGDQDQSNLRTLYDILGASPTDSYQTLRQKYTTLARQMHPDANPTQRLDATEFTQVVAAWRVLADPKERLKYDRSLKAKEFTENMEQWFEMGMRTAIPFMKKTANTTMSAVATSSQTITNVSQRMGVAMDLLELDRKTKVLEQQ